MSVASVNVSPYEHMDVSKNRGTPKWMVKITENPIKMDDLGVPLFLERPICWYIVTYADGVVSLSSHVWTKINH